MIQAAHVLVLSMDDELILQQRDNKPNTEGPGQISTWGGACDPGELPIEAAIRELREELGLVVKANELTFWRQYRKTKISHGKDQIVHMFIFNEKVNPDSLIVYEGAGYQLIKTDQNLNEVKLSLLATEFVRDFFKQLGQRSIDSSPLSKEH